MTVDVLSQYNTTKSRQRPTFSHFTERLRTVRAQLAASSASKVQKLSRLIRLSVINASSAWPDGGHSGFRGMFSVLRRHTSSALSKLPSQIFLRHASTAAAFVPPAALQDVVERRRRPLKTKPTSPTFYTGRSSYYDQIIALEACITTARQVLKDLHLHPLPNFARASIPPARPMWKDNTTLVRDIDVKLNPGRYRRILTLLNQLDEYRRIAEVAGCTELAENIADLLSGYEKENKEAILASGRRKPVQFDEYGRTYTTGKRKESSARVWVIPVQPKQQTSADQKPQAPQLSLPASLPTKTPTSMLPDAIEVTTSSILINNVPLAEYL